MEMFGNFGSNSDLSSSIGLSNTGNQFWNLTPAELVEDTILQGEGLLTDTGALAIDTGEFTGRSPKDRFIVEDELTKDTVWWGDINKGISPNKFDTMNDFNRTARNWHHPRLICQKKCSKLNLIHMNR